MNKERIEEIRKGWVTDYPNPKFTGDKIQCLLSIECAQRDIKFLLEEIDKRLPMINTILYAGMSICYEFKGEDVYWVGWDCGSWVVFGPSKVLGKDYSDSKYQLSLDSCLLTTALPISEHVYLTKEEAEKKCEELKNER